LPDPSDTQPPINSFNGRQTPDKLEFQQPVRRREHRANELVTDLVTNALRPLGTGRDPLAPNAEFRFTDQHLLGREQTAKYGGDQITKPLLYH
jgi:hypothetical protein